MQLAQLREHDMPSHCLPGSAGLAGDGQQGWTVPGLSWAILVRKSVGAVDGVEGLAEVVGDGVGGGDDLPSGLDLDGVVAADPPETAGPPVQRQRVSSTVASASARHHRVDVR
jgi:hypothetical protein